MQSVQDWRKGLLSPERRQEILKSVVIDKSRNGLLTEQGYTTVVDRYLMPGEVCPQEAFARAAAAYADDEAHAQRLYDYASKHWFMFSTPILSNGGTERGLGISCNLSEVPDSREGLVDHYAENVWLTSQGAGIGTYWGNLRGVGEATSKGSESTGLIPFLHVADSQVLAFSQGRTRRGAYAAYLDVSHPEIEEFLEMRKPSGENGGDPHRKNLNLHHAVNLPDVFMEAVKDGRDWDLVDPHSQKVVKTVSARGLWAKILELRMQTGEPYLHFVDTTNKHLNDEQKGLGFKVKTSNLCSEITLVTSKTRTAVCCLSSVNLEYYDEWKYDPLFIEDLVRMLDNVIEHYIHNAGPGLAKAAYSAKAERSLGLGAMGWHALLQKRGVPWESALATSLNYHAFDHIKSRAVEASEKLAEERGPCGDAALVDSKRRHLNLLAIAPNATSSIICGGTSPSIEPFRANVYSSVTSSGLNIVKNKFLQMRLQELGLDTPDVWRRIVADKGSVQNVEGLPDWDKDVFKTAMEIDQRWLVEQAAQRQKFICQAQSLNLFFEPTVSKKELHVVHMEAWKKGLKTLYYCRSDSVGAAEVISEKVERFSYDEPVIEESTCLSCEG